MESAPFKITSTLISRVPVLLSLTNPALDTQLHHLLDPVRANLLSSPALQQPLLNVFCKIWQENETNAGFLAVHPHPPNHITVETYYRLHHPAVNLIPDKISFESGATSTGPQWNNEIKIAGSLTGAWVSAFSAKYCGGTNPLGLKRIFLDEPIQLAQVIVTAYCHELMYGGVEWYGAGLVNTTREEFCSGGGVYFEEQILGGALWGHWDRGHIGHWGRLNRFIISRPYRDDDDEIEETDGFKKIATSLAFAEAITSLLPDDNYPLLPRHEKTCETWQEQEGQVKAKVLPLILGLTSPDVSPRGPLEQEDRSGTAHGTKSDL